MQEETLRAQEEAELGLDPEESGSRVRLREEETIQSWEQSPRSNSRGVGLLPRCSDRQRVTEGVWTLTFGPRS